MLSVCVAVLLLAVPTVTPDCVPAAFTTAEAYRYLECSARCVLGADSLAILCDCVHDVVHTMSKRPRPQSPEYDADK